MQSSYQKQHRLLFTKSKISVLATSVAMASMLTATSAQAVTGLRTGVPVEGNITTSSPRDESDNTPYQLYLYQGTPGERVQFDLKSNAFDPYLIVGSDAKNDPYCSDCKSNDDGGDELNSRIFYVVPDGGNVYIRAGMIDTEYGRFTLEAKRLPPAKPSTTLNLAARAQRNTQLQQNSAMDDDGKYYQLYKISGQAGSFVTVKMTSDDIDSYLELVNSDLEVMDYDDDSLDESDARLKVQLDERGQALIKATSYDSLETGNYTITTQPLNAVTVINPTKTIRVGSATQGELRTGEPLYDGDYYFDAYRIQGLPGQRVQINLDSSDFDTYLRWGYNANGKFNTLSENDDVNEDSVDYDAEDTNSQLSITLDRDGKGVLMVTTYEPEATGKYRLSIIESQLP